MTETTREQEMATQQDSLVYETAYGEVELQEDRLMSFPEGILGFQHCTVFGLAQHPQYEDSAVMILQCVNDPEVTFAVIDSASIGITYSEEEKADALKAAGLEAENAVFLLVLRSHGDQEQQHVTANVRAPIIIDTKALTAKQYIMLNKDYSTQHQL